MSEFELDCPSPGPVDESIRMRRQSTGARRSNIDFINQAEMAELQRVRTYIIYEASLTLLASAFRAPRTFGNLRAEYLQNVKHPIETSDRFC